MTDFVYGMVLASELAKVLKIDRPIRSIVINADCRGSASVTVEFIPTVNDAVMIAAFLKTYQLVQVEPIETRHVDV